MPVTSSLLFFLSIYIIFIYSTNELIEQYSVYESKVRNCSDYKNNNKKKHCDREKEDTFQTKQQQKRKNEEKKNTKRKIQLKWQ